MTIAIWLDVLEAGVISTRTQRAALTLVGLVTTVTTGPLLTRSRRARGCARRRRRPRPPEPRSPADARR